MENLNWKPALTRGIFEGKKLFPKEMISKIEGKSDFSLCKSFWVIVL